MKLPVFLKMFAQNRLWVMLSVTTVSSGFSDLCGVLATKGANRLIGENEIPVIQVTPWQRGQSGECGIEPQDFS